LHSSEFISITSNTYKHPGSAKERKSDKLPYISAQIEGKKIGQVALHFGADDFGGTLEEENVHAAAKIVNKTSTEEVIQLIQESGFNAAQRDTLYNVLKIYDT